MNNCAPDQVTAVSLHAVLPVPPGPVAVERRVEERQTTLLRVGKLVTGGEQRLCMIRNISSAGAMLRIYQPLSVGEAVEVEVTPDWPVAGSVIWAQEDLAGIAFAEPIDVITALRGGTRQGPYRRVARTPRLEVRRPAVLCTDSVEADATLCDLSLNGAKLETAVVLGSNVEVAIFVEGLPPLAGRVRWCLEGRLGIEFDIPIRLERLAEWVGANGTTIELEAPSAA